jgi:hypothetical protein
VPERTADGHRPASWPRDLVDRKGTAAARKGSAVRTGTAAQVAARRVAGQKGPVVAEEWQAVESWFEPPYWLARAGRNGLLSTGGHLIQTFTGPLLARCRDPGLCRGRPRRDHTSTQRTGHCAGRPRHYLARCEKHRGTRPRSNQRRSRRAASSRCGMTSLHHEARAVEELEQRREVASDVEEHDRLGDQPELVPCEHFERLA